MIAKLPHRWDICTRLDQVRSTRDDGSAVPRVVLELSIPWNESLDQFNRWAGSVVETHLRITQDDDEGNSPHVAFADVAEIIHTAAQTAQLLERLSTSEITANRLTSAYSHLHAAEALILSIDESADDPAKTG